MQNGNKQEYGDFMLVLCIVFILFFAFIAKYFFYYYLYAWRGFGIGLFFIMQYIPGFIHDILFIWGPSDIEGKSAKIVNLLMIRDNDYFVKNKNVYEQVNMFMNVLFRPYLVVLFLYSAYIIFSKKSFKRRFLPIKNEKKPELSKSAIDVLLQQEAKIWPSTQIMINEHPEKVSNLDEGKWAMSKRPEIFVKFHKLVDEFTDEYDKKFFKLNEERTFKVMNAQMGKVWNGFNNLTKVERQIFAILAPKIARNTAESKSINELIASSYTTGKKSGGLLSLFGIKNKEERLLNKKIDSTIKKYMNDEKVKAILNRHFYKKTVFAAFLETARDDGVIATSEFLWLKTVDRELWYMLNNVGRKSAFPECAAPWSHFLAEKALDRKVANPMIQNAIIALDQYLFDTSYDFQRIYKPETDTED